MGLRARRKRETTNLIRTATLELATERGLDNVTVEMICDAAGISVRTFFNYFAYKEAALILGPPPFPAEAVADFLTGTGTVADDLADLSAAQMQSDPFDRRTMRGVMEISMVSPKVAMYQLSRFHENEDELTSLLARRLGLAADDDRAYILATVTITAIRAAIERWTFRETGDIESEIRAAVSLLGPIYG